MAAAKTAANVKPVAPRGMWWTMKAANASSPRPIGCFGGNCSN
jgi:hypothetical protein